MPDSLALFPARDDGCICSVRADWPLPFHTRNCAVERLSVESEGEEKGLVKSWEDQPLSAPGDSQWSTLKGYFAPQLDEQ
eukprot:2164944-Rhodomonas_salina.5